MIIWINGAFGSGKTTVSCELSMIMANSFVFDPENIGFFFHKNFPPHMATGDFQDIPLWREFNYKMLKRVRENFNGVIVVPMTITNPEYYHEIIGKLREDGIDVRHFVLGADAGTLKKRLKKRLNLKPNWALSKIPVCVEAFKNPVFENYIDTNNRCVSEIGRLICDNLGVPYVERNKLYKQIFRLLNSIRHIRF